MLALLEVWGWKRSFVFVGPYVTLPGSVDGETWKHTLSFIRIICTFFCRLVELKPEMGIREMTSVGNSTENIVCVRVCVSSFSMCLHL